MSSHGKEESMAKRSRIDDLELGADRAVAADHPTATQSVATVEQSTASTESVNELSSGAALHGVHRRLELLDLPVEVLFEIFIQAAIASVSHDSDDDAVEEVLTSLGDVCRKLRAVVSDGDFRRKFWRKLMQIDPAFLFPNSSSFYRLHLPDPDNVVKKIDHIVTLGDELFGVNAKDSGFIHVWTVGNQPERWRMPGHVDGLSDDVYRCMTFEDGPANGCIRDIQGCQANRSLYVSMSNPDGNIIFRLRSTDGARLARWSIPRAPSRMTVVDADGSVIATDAHLNQLRVHDADGRLLRVVPAGGGVLGQILFGALPAASGSARDGPFVTLHIEGIDLFGSPLQSALGLRMSAITLVAGRSQDDAADENGEEPEPTAIADVTFSRHYATITPAPCAADGVGHLFAVDSVYSRSSSCYVDVFDAAEFRLRRTVVIQCRPPSLQLGMTAFHLDARRGRLFAVVEVGRRHDPLREKMFVCADVWRRYDAEPGRSTML